MSTTSVDQTMRAADQRAADRLLLRVARDGGAWLVVLSVTTVALAAAEIALPAVLGKAIDAAVGNGSTTWLTWFGLLVGALVVADALDDLAAGEATARSTASLRHSVVAHLLALGPRAQRFNAGDVANRVSANTADAGRVAPDVVRAGANVLPAVGATVALFLIDPWLCLTFLLAVPLLAVLIRSFARDASGIARDYLSVQGAIAGRLVDALGGSRTIAAACTQGRESERVLEPLPDLHRHGVAMWLAQMRMAAQDAAIAPLVGIAVLAVAGAELGRGRITPGELLAAAQYALLATALGSAVTAVTRLASARAGAGRAAEILAVEPMAYGTARVTGGAGRLEFRGVTVSSEGRRVLDGVDLVVPPGSLVAIVGSSGGGKSLLAALAGRLVDPDEGEVLLDGIPLPMLSRAELRRLVTYGFERPVLVGDTLADVIALGADEAGDDVVAAAAKAAQADGFISRMPDGYRTLVADAPMSGGEVQRVGLARTFAHAGRVIVLDDVAASLDTVTEHDIAAVLTGALADRTRLVIAHRASTAARASFVVWLDDGRVRAVASHRRLWWERDYRALFRPATTDGADE